MAQQGGQVGILAVDPGFQRQQPPRDFGDRLFEGGAQILDQRRLGRWLVGGGDRRAGESNRSARCGRSSPTPSASP